MNTIKKYREWLSNAGFLFIAIAAVNAGNYLINLALGRILGPGQFAEASILATVVLIISFIALGFQIGHTKFAASFFAEKRTHQLSALKKWFSRNALISGMIISVLLVLLIVPVKNYLQFNSTLPLLIIIAGIPIYLVMSSNRGHLQGTHEFMKLSYTYILEMVFRLAVTFILIFILIEMGLDWSSEAVAIGFLVSFLASYWISRNNKYTRRISNMNLGTKDKKLILGFMGIVGIYEMSQILINNSDIILIKHYFSNHEAGLYAALALVGRIVFFATFTVVTLLIPKVIQKEKQGLPHGRLFMNAFALVMCVGALITLACYIAPESILLLLFGSEYLAISHLMWLYAVSTTLFSCANVFAYYYMSLDNYLPVAFSVLAGIAQIVSIQLFHSSLLEVVFVQIIIMGVLLFIMIFFHTLNKIQNEKVKISYRYSLPSR